MSSPKVATEDGEVTLPLQTKKIKLELNKVEVTNGSDVKDVTVMTVKNGGVGDESVKVNPDIDMDALVAVKVENSVDKAKDVKFKVEESIDTAASKVKAEKPSGPVEKVQVETPGNENVMPDVTALASGDVKPDVDFNFVRPIKQEKEGHATASTQTDLRNDVLRLGSVDDTPTLVVGPPSKRKSAVAVDEPDTAISREIKKAKLETKALKAKRPGFTDERYNETSYYTENGLRKVYPYYFTFTTFTKGRWVGEKILDVFAKEFRAHPVEEYERCIKSGTLTVNYTKVETVNFILSMENSEDGLSCRDLPCSLGHFMSRSDTACEICKVN
ncbi:unnamed protein product [Orchesella dallaii]|uniref:RNA pseudouridylate synthase domain-containing protein 2 n=1 Tax=Orchesella dallaii TaxID=48710 RepID=A0ABP1Q3I9_9HEXA